MWRAFFLATGISLIILGAESLAIEQVVLVPRSSVAPTSALSTAAPKQTIVVKPAEWWPWTFMATGAVVVLYSFTIPRRVAS
jgi:hypothetical protein